MGNLLVPTLVMTALAVALYAIGWYRGMGEDVEGLKRTGNMLFDLLPLLVAAFLVAGMVQVLIPGKFIGQWVGRESGIRGILIGSVAGGLAPGGPYVSMPIAAGLLQAGAGIGTMVAFMTGWSLWAVARLPMEFGIMGWKFTLIRLACSAVFPPLAGILAHVFFSKYWNG